MKASKLVLCAGFLACSLTVCAQKQKPQPDPQGVLSYSLPATSLVLEVEAVQENFYAGPYAKYASKYLGVEAKQKDSQAYTISRVSLTPYVEADQNSRFIIDAGNGKMVAAFLKLTSMGLVARTDGSFGEESAWRFPSPASGDFSGVGLTSNFMSEAATLYQNVKHESAYSRVAVKQEIIVEKSEEKRAAETAAMIFDIREKRYQIVTGDTDATYSGEAMGAAVAELTRLEKEYMSMFTGYSEYQTQTKTFEILPERDRENQLYVAFRLSDTAGLLPADNISGKPVILEVVPQPVAPAVEEGKKISKKSRDNEFVTYRIPALCTVKLTDGMNVLFQSRVPVYQLGAESSLPLNIEVK